MGTTTLTVVTTRISLDVSRMDIQNNIPVTQGDTKRRIEVTLMNAGQPLSVKEDWTVTLTGIKPDESKLAILCDVSEGKIIFDFAKGEEIATAAGAFYVQFNIVDEVGDLLATPKIWISVVANSMREMESKDQLQAFRDVIDLANDNEVYRTEVVMNAIERSEEINQEHIANEAARQALSAETIQALNDTNTAVQTEEDQRKANENDRELNDEERGQRVDAAIQALNDTNAAVRTEENQRKDNENERRSNDVDRGKRVDAAIQAINATNTAVGQAEDRREANEDAREALKTELIKLKADLQEMIDALPDRVAELPALIERINAVLDSDDETLDELSEIVTYIKSNKSLIENITTNKVNVADIIDNLVTNAAKKPLSAAQGYKLKELVDTAQTAAGNAATAAGNAQTTANEAKTAAQNAQNTANGKEPAGTAKTMLNRTTKVNAADTNYATYMARGVSLNAAETSPTVNGTIAWHYK